MKKSLTLTALCTALALSFAPSLAVSAPAAAKVSGAVSDHARKQLDILADQYYDAAGNMKQSAVTIYTFKNGAPAALASY